MRIVIFGATGATGQETVTQALAAGHEVTIFARRPFNDVQGDRPPVVIVGDLLDREAVERAVRNQDAVISALGPRRKGPSSTCADGTRVILSAMARTGVRRLLVVSAHGVAESRDWSLYSIAVWTALPAKMRDKEAMEALIHNSAVDWTIVRAPALTNGPRSHRCRVGEDTRIKITSRVSRVDLAGFLLASAVDGSFVYGKPRIVS